MKNTLKVSSPEKSLVCCMEVRRILVMVPEVIYQRAIAIEFSRQNINFTREHEMDIRYKEEVIGARRVDFFVKSKVRLEIKALIRLEDVHLAQAINYLGHMA